MMKINHFFQLKQWTLVLVGLFCMSAVLAQVEITCPSETDLGTYDCTTIDNVPDPPSNKEEAAAAPYNIIITNATGSTRVDTEDSNVIFYCATDARTVTRTVSVYEDANFNFVFDEDELIDECTYTISTIEDTTPPVFTAPPLANLPCDVNLDDLSITGEVVDISDENCPVNNISEATFYADAVAQGSCPGNFVITRSWTAVDPCGNTSDTQTQRIEITDTEGPEFTVPEDVTLDCGADVEDLTLTGAVTDAVDSCNPGVIIEANFIEIGRETQPDGCDELTIITRRWVAIDDCDNPTTKDQIITIRCEAEIPTCNTDPCVGDIEKLAADGCSCEFDEAQVLGCTDATAQNYRADANCDDGSCNFTVAGCTDGCAPNYNPDATEDDGSCEPYPTECNSDCTAGDTEVWDAATCSCVIDEVTVSGCTDETACNFSTGANCDDGSCKTPEVCNDDICLGDITDSIGSDPCGCYLVEKQVLGCADATADNYNPDANCDDGSCIYEPLCSYTQGFWGNKGGKQNGLTTTEMIDAALASAGGSITIGADGQSLTVSSAQCVLALLPSSSGPRALASGDEIYEGNCSQNKKNRIRNRLAGETLVLSLNTLNSPGLNSVVLCDPANCLVDRVPDSVCDILGDGGTIADLLVLANEVLGGIYEVADKNLYSDMNESINVISERYDECRNPCGGGGERLGALNSMIDYFEVKPNPVKDMLTLEFDANVEKRDVKVEIYQLNGQKVFEQTILSEVGLQRNTINLSSIPQGIYMVSLNVDGEVFTKKIIKENQ